MVEEMINIITKTLGFLAIDSRSQLHTKKKYQMGYIEIDRASKYNLSYFLALFFVYCDEGKW